MKERSDSIAQTVLENRTEMKEVVDDKCEGLEGLIEELRSERAN